MFQPFAIAGIHRISRRACDRRNGRGERWLRSQPDTLLLESVFKHLSQPHARVRQVEACRPAVLTDEAFTGEDNESRVRASASLATVLSRWTTYSIRVFMLRRGGQGKWVINPARRHAQGQGSTHLDHAEWYLPGSPDVWKLLSLHSAPSSSISPFVSVRPASNSSSIVDPSARMMAYAPDLLAGM